MGKVERETRNSNLEILRIISMILIVAHHYAVHGFKEIEMAYSLNRYVVDILSCGGQLGVSCFVLISGYFMVYSRFTFRKLLKLIAEIWFYSVGIGILFLFILTPIEPIGIKSFIMMFIPVGYGSYWFMTYYIMLMLISPALNLLLSIMSKEMHRNIIFGATILWSIIPGFISASYGCNELGWFVVLYLMAAYIRKYMHLEKHNACKHFFVAIISYLLMIAANVSLDILGYRMNMDALVNLRYRIIVLNSPFVLVTSIELLIAFAKLKPYRNRLINTLASATLGVYLIHDNLMFRPYLWRVLLKNQEMYSSKLLIVHAMICILLVYLICIIIDLIRQITIEKLFFRIIDRYYEPIKRKVFILVEHIKIKVQTVIDWYYK